MAAVRENFLGSYRLLRIITTTKACQICEALHQMDNVRVVIKMLLKDYRTNRDEIAALKQEYNVGKDLENSNIIRVYEYNVHRDIPYIVMELFNHPNMKQALRDQPEAIALQTESIAEGAARGLSYIHEQGWVHCDIKPENYLVDSKGHTKLIDFSIARKPKKGLARLLGGKPKVQGTMSYMAPEQIRGEAIDPKTDIYSFGCTLFELVSGRPPFTGKSSNDLLNRHLKGKPPSAVAANAKVTNEFSELIVQMLAKRPVDRPHSMDEVLDRLDKITIFRA